MRKSMSPPGFVQPSGRNAGGLFMGHLIKSFLLVVLSLRGSLDRNAIPSGLKDTVLPAFLGPKSNLCVVKSANTQRKIINHDLYDTARNRALISMYIL